MAFQTTITRAELVTRTLEKLRVTGTGQSPSNEETALVDKLIEPAFDELQRRDIVSLNANGTIPAAYQEHLADFIGQLAARDFGLPSDPNIKRFAEVEIRAIDADGPTFQPLKVDSIYSWGDDQENNSGYS